MNVHRRCLLLYALVPKYADTPPRYIIRDQPFKVSRDRERRFTLYSVGWNERDGGGVAATNPSDRDCVWTTVRPWSVLQSFVADAVEVGAAT